MDNETNMLRGNPMQLLLGFAIPMMFGNAFQQLYTVADTAIIGRGVGMYALSALGCIDWLCWMMTSIIQGFSQGFSIRISQKYGEGNLPEMKKFIGQSAILSVFLAVFYLFVGQFTLNFLLRLMRVPAELYDMAEIYMRVLLLGAPAIAFFNFCSALLRAIGDSKTPLKAMMAASILNIVLDLIAVFGLHLGIAGAAAATVIAQCFSGVICFIKIKNTEILRFGKKELQRNLSILKNLTLLGTPTAAKNITIAFGGILVQTVVNGFGTGFIAGFTATAKLFGLLEIAAVSYGYAITTYVGQNYGAKQYERIRSGVHSAVILALITSVIIALAMVLFGRQLTSLFISSDIAELASEAKYIAYSYLCTMAVFLPFLYLLYVFLSTLQGMGYTLSTLVSGIIELMIRVIVCIFVIKTGWKMGIFGAEVIAWIGAVIFLAAHFSRKIKSLTNT